MYIYILYTRPSLLSKIPIHVYDTVIPADTMNDVVCGISINSFALLEYYYRSYFGIFRNIPYVALLLAAAVCSQLASHCGISINSFSHSLNIIIAPISGYPILGSHCCYCCCCCMFAVRLRTPCGEGFLKEMMQLYSSSSQLTSHFYSTILTYLRESTGTGYIICAFTRTHTRDREKYQQCRGQRR